MRWLSEEPFEDREELRSVFVREVSVQRKETTCQNETRESWTRAMKKEREREKKKDVPRLADDRDLLRRTLRVVSARSDSGYFIDCFSVKGSCSKRWSRSQTKEREKEKRNL